MTQPLVDALQAIHDDTFGKASKNISRFQENYAKQYDRRHKNKGHKNDIKLRKGMNVQYEKYKSKTPKGKGGLKWFPRNRPLKIHSIDHQSRTVYLRDAKTGYVQKRSHPFERIRPFRGRFKKVSKK